MESLFILILLFSVWLKIALLSAGVEITLFALVASTFALSKYRVMTYSLFVGLILDYFSALPFGVLTAALILSIFLFLFLKQSLSFNSARSVILSCILTIIFYEFCAWGFFRISSLLFGKYNTPQYIPLFVAGIRNNSFIVMLAFNIFFISLVSFFLKRYTYERGIKISG